MRLRCQKSEGKLAWSVKLDLVASALYCLNLNGEDLERISLGNVGLPDSAAAGTAACLRLCARAKSNPARDANAPRSARNICGLKTAKLRLSPAPNTYRSLIHGAVYNQINTLINRVGGGDILCINYRVITISIRGTGDRVIKV